MTFPIKLTRGSLLALALLTTTSLTGLGGNLLGAGSVQAQQQRLISAVLFEGNTGFSDAQLLTMVNVATTGAFSDSVIASDAESIRLAYVSKGYVGVTVTPRIEPSENGRSRVIFVVNEGQRTGIAAINFTGNNSIDTGTLKSVLRTHETGILSWLFRDDTYNEDQLLLDRQLIEFYYANHGFPDAMVTSAVGEYDASRNAYFVNFTIVEGERYSFGSVGIETSIPGLDTNALKGVIRSREGSRYSLRDLQQTQEDMAKEATSQGYAFADVRPRVERDPSSNRFNVTYLVDEGARIYVERINITGNEKTRDAVIRRELDFGEGDPFNRSIVQRGKAAIEKLGFFKTVAVNFSQGSAPDKVVIDVAVVEQSTGDYGVTAGYSSTDGVLGEVSITERNFLGRGQFVRAAIGASGSGQTVDFSFTEPHFMGLNISAGFDVYHRINEETVSNIYGTTATGGQLRFGMPVTRDLVGSVFVGFEQKTISDHQMLDLLDETDPDNPVPGNDGIDDTDAPKSSIVNDGDVFNKIWSGYSLVYNTLDDAKHPTEGFYATFTQQYINLQAPDRDYNLLKSEARARYFMPLMQDAGIIGSIKGQAGIVNSFDSSGNVHPLEAFQHSSSLVRGFLNRGMGPRSVESGESLGYTAYVAASAEIEFPIPVLPETYGVRGSVWADAAWIDGVGSNGVYPASTPTAGSMNTDIRSSIGASIIWDSPLGPLRGDYAYIINKADEDRTQQFSLTLQQLL